MDELIKEMSYDLAECHVDYLDDAKLYTDYDTMAQKMVSRGYRRQSEGEWIEHDDDWCGAFYTCSVCGCDWTTIDGTPQENNMRFCPECGAKMKGGAE